VSEQREICGIWVFETYFDQIGAVQCDTVQFLKKLKGIIKFVIFDFIMNREFMVGQY